MGDIDLRWLDTYSDDRTIEEEGDAQKKQHTSIVIWKDVRCDQNLEICTYHRGQKQCHFLLCYLSRQANLVLCWEQLISEAPDKRARGEHIDHLHNAFLRPPRKWTECHPFVTKTNGSTSCTRQEYIIHVRVILNSGYLGPDPQGSEPMMDDDLLCRAEGYCHFD